MKLQISLIALFLVVAGLLPAAQAQNASAVDSLTVPSEFVTTPASGQGLVTISKSTLGLHTIGGAATPTTVTPGAGAGTTPTITLATNSTDTAGQINVTTGTTPTASSPAVTVTFTLPYATSPFVTLTPANAATAALAVAAQVYPSATTTTFVINTNGTALTASTAYSWYFSVRPQ